MSPEKEIQLIEEQAWYLLDLSLENFMASCMVLDPGLNKPTGPVKPARSDSGLPDWFDRKPVETGQI